MEEKKYIKLVNILMEQIISLELDNTCKSFEIDRLKKELETTLDQIEVHCPEKAVNEVETEKR